MHSHESETKWWWCFIRGRESRNNSVFWVTLKNNNKNSMERNSSVRLFRKMMKIFHYRRIKYSFLHFLLLFFDNMIISLLLVAGSDGYYWIAIIIACICIFITNFQFDFSNLFPWKWLTLSYELFIYLWAFYFSIIINIFIHQRIAMHLK